VYCSNESPVNVFFDNLQVIHTKSALLEETHYYPFGLKMAGISSKAFKAGSPENKFKFNGKEEQGNEFADGTGLDWLDYGARMYDAQTARWNHIDGKVEKFMPLSPYVYAGNNPILFVDPDGKDLKPSPTFQQSPYNAVYEKMKTSNSVYKKYVVERYDKDPKFHYVLDIKQRGEGEHRSAQGGTYEVTGTRKESRLEGITALTSQTDFYKFGETRSVNVDGKTETRGLNEAGRALVVLHEGLHAGIQKEGGIEYAGHKQMIAGDPNSYRSDIEQGLKEYNEQNNLGLSKEQVNNLSYYGLQGTNEFDTHFGLNKNDADYAEKQKAVIDGLDKLIYTEKDKDKDKDKK
jgi:RHS repeat-associated protein